MFFCKETNTRIDAKIKLIGDVVPTYLKLLRDPHFISSVIISGIGMSAMILYVTISPFLLQTQFQLTPIQYGWVTSLVGIGIILGRFTNGFISNKVGNFISLKYSTILLFFSGSLILISIAVNSLNIFMLMFSVLIALYAQVSMRSNSMYIALLPHTKVRGSAGYLFACGEHLAAFFRGSIISLISFIGVGRLGFLYLLFAALAYYILVKYMNCIPSARSKITI